MAQIRVSHQAKFKFFLNLSFKFVLSTMAQKGQVKKSDEEDLLKRFRDLEIALDKERKAKEEALAREKEEREAKDKAQGRYCITLSDLGSEEKPLLSKTNLKRWQKSLEHGWFNDFLPPLDTDFESLESKNRRNCGQYIGFTLFGVKRSKEVNGTVISTKWISQAAHAAPYGSCTEHWNIIPHYLLKFPLNKIEDKSKLIKAVMNGWQSKSGRKEDNAGFGSSFSNIWAMDAQGQHADFYPSTFACPAETLERLLNSKPTDEIGWVVIFSDALTAVQVGACGEDQTYLALSDPLVQQAFKTYAELLPLLASLAVLDPTPKCSDQKLSAQLRAYLRENKKIPVPLLPTGSSTQPRYVHYVKLRGGVIVRPGTKISEEEKIALKEGPHGLEPFTLSAKLSQAWTTYLHSRGMLEFQGKTEAEAKACSLFPGCEGVDENGLPECDEELARQILSGTFDVDFTEDELNHAKDSLAGNRDAMELRGKIQDWMRTVRHSFTAWLRFLLIHAVFVEQIPAETGELCVLRVDREGGAHPTPTSPCPVFEMWQLATVCICASPSDLANGIFLRFLLSPPFSC